MTRTAVIAIVVLTCLFALAAPRAWAAVPFALPPELVADTLLLPRASAIGDLDGDGSLDIVTVEQSGGRVTWHQNRLREGQGWQSWPIDLAIENPVAVAVGDLTGNGYLDVAVAAFNLTPGGISVAWYTNNGAPASNSEWARQTTATGLFNTVSISIADINRNGRKDIITSAARGSVGPFELVWFENVLFEGNTTILDVNARIIDDNLPGIGSVAVGDITRNGYPDVAVVASFGGMANPQRLVAYYENNGSPAAGPWNQVAIDDDFASPSRVLLADLTGNGALDVIAVSRLEDRLATFLNTSGDGSSWTPGVDLSPDAPSTLAAADLNHNGVLDLVVGTQGAVGGDRVFWYENDGSGNLTENPIFSVVSEAQFHVATGDLRGDGDVDIVVTRGVGGTVSLIENATIHRNAVFNRPGTGVASAFGHGGDVLAADLNRDGQPDLIATSPGQGIVRWWANTGNGAGWSANTIANGLAGVGPLAVGDLSRNGRLEVVAAAPGSTRIEAFFAQNAAATNWSGVAVTTNYARVSDVAVVDVDGDGMLDVIAASPDSPFGDIVWFENQLGTGTAWAFPQVILSSQTGAPGPEVLRPLAVGDLTRNTLPDVVSGLTGIDGLTWHRNNGGSFTAFTVDANFALADRPRIADVDRDGALDIIAVGRVSGGAPQLVWFRNVNGDGSSWQRIPIATGTGVFGLLAVGDLTQDGAVDILARTPSPRLYANDGTGVFTQQVQALLDLTGRVALADFDRSGDLDAAGLRAGTGDVNGLDLGWFENAGGQFSFDTQDFASPALAESAVAPVLGIAPLHLGREGDSDIQWTSLELRFETATGAAHTSGDLGALLDSITLYLDDGDGLFDMAEDTLLATLNSFNLVDGVETLDFATNDDDFRQVLGQDRMYWVVATAQPDGSTAFPLPRFRVVHRTENSSTAIDAEFELPLVPSFTPNGASKVVQVIDPATTPLITLLGPNPLLWEGGDEPYDDPGAVVDDPNEISPVNIGPDDPNAVDVNALGSYAVTFNYSNLGQDAPEVTRTVNVVDNTPPVITLVGNSSITVEAATVYNDAGATAFDSLEGELTAQISVSNPVNTFVLGVHTVRYNVNDSSGNAAVEVTRTVTVEDTTPPVITLLGGASINAEAGQPFTDPGATAHDALDGDVSASIAVTGSVDTGTIGVYELRYNVSDNTGNAALEAVRTVTVADTTPPVITLLGGASIAAEAGEPFTDPGATALDSFDGDVSAGILVTGSVDTETIAVYELRYNVTDNAGNAALEAVRTVTVADTTPPVITLNGGASMFVGQDDDFVDPGALAFDSFEGELTDHIVVTGAVDTGTVGVYELRYNVSDSTGNAAVEVVRTVTVTQNPPPVITLIGAASITVEAGDSFTDPGATAQDFQSTDLTAEIVVSGAVDTGTLGVYALRYNVTDNFGVPANELVRTVTVADSTPPVITLIGGANLSVQQGGVFLDPGATALDSFEGDLTEGIIVTGGVDTGTAGVYELRYNVSDSSGNAALERVRTVTVTQNPPPVITLIGPVSITVEAGDAFTDPGATAQDFEGSDLTASIVVTGSVNTGALGVFELRYNVTDGFGAPASEVVRTVTVADTTAPVITLLGEATMTIEEGADFVDPGATASDSLEGDLTASIVVTGVVDTETPGEYLLRYNVSDSSGNAALEVTRTVLVEEGGDPRDINGDGLVNAVDVQLVINAALGISIAPLSGDVNGDGFVNAVDVQLVINGALGL